MRKQSFDMYDSDKNSEKTRSESNMSFEHSSVLEDVIDETFEDVTESKRPDDDIKGYADELASYLVRLTLPDNSHDVVKGTVQHVYSKWIYDLWR